MNPDYEYISFSYDEVTSRWTFWRHQISGKMAVDPRWVVERFNQLAREVYTTTSEHPENDYG